MFLNLNLFEMLLKQALVVFCEFVFYFRCIYFLIELCHQVGNTWKKAHRPACADFILTGTEQEVL